MRNGAAGGAPRLRFTGTLAALSEAERRALIERRTSDPALEAARARALEIVDEVRHDGDRALIRLARELDQVADLTIEVPRGALDAARDALDPELRRALERAARNLATFHRAQLPPPLQVETEPGVTLGRRADPLERVGIYAPGGRAPYPSSALMAAIPARVVGVREIVLCSPPEPGGLPAAPVLAAAAIGGVDRVFALGGAGAIAALAHGTETVPRVDRIVGPGNAYVAAAKIAVAGQVGIDSPAGPSEVLALADETADPAHVARELVAQAEHDPLACAVAIAIGSQVASAIERALGDLLAGLGAESRRAIVLESLAQRGGVLAAASREEAIAFANAYAPEHLLLLVAGPERALAAARHAGTVFLGEGASVAFGDYMTGANHVLPTGGFARAFSGLSAHDFVRWTTWQRIDAGAASALASDVAAFAEAERLPGHAAAARAFARPAPDGATARATPAAAAPGPRESYRDLTLYVPDRAPVRLDLSDNTNAFGIPPAARRVLRAAPSEAVTRYPSVYSDALRQALAAYVGATPAEIVTGCGSDDVIDSAVRAFAEPGDRLAYFDPTFGMVAAFARMNALVPVPVPRGTDPEADADLLLATGARILYLCSPNNPTGGLLPARTLERVVARASGLVILDQAYAEFVRVRAPMAAPPAAAIGAPLPRASRLLVVRTLSKAFGLAGLRVGYGVATPEIAAAVTKSRGPFKVGATAERAAIAALTDDLDWVRSRVRAVRRNRVRFVRALRNLDLRPLPSQANFVLLPVPDAALALAALRARGIGTRPFPKLAGIGDALRITIGRRHAMDEVAAALGDLRHEHGIVASSAPAPDGAPPLNSAVESAAASASRTTPRTAPRPGTEPR